MLGRTNIHSPIDQHIEAQAATGAELQRADATLDSIVEDHAADATQGAEIASKPCETASIELASM